MASCKRSALTYTLTLSEAEAIVLRYLMANIAGPSSGPRGCCDSVKDALDDAGVSYVIQPITPGSDRIHFNRTTTTIFSSRR